MKDRYNILFVVFSIIFIVASIFSVYADSSNSSNSLNSSNLTNSTNSITAKNASKSIIVQPMSVGPDAGVDPTTIDLGNFTADGTERSFSRVTTVSVWSWGGSGNLYISASGDFTSGTNRIALSNFKYSGQYSGGTISKKPFTTDNTLLKSYSGLLHYEDVYMTYYMAVPSGTLPGNYSTTIYYTAT